MESHETTARAHFQEKMQFREVRETLEGLKQTRGRTAFPRGFWAHFSRGCKSKTLREIEFSWK